MRWNSSDGRDTYETMITDRISERMEQIIRERFGEPVMDPPEHTVFVTDERDKLDETYTRKRQMVVTPARWRGRTSHGS